MGATTELLTAEIDEDYCIRAAHFFE